MSSSTFDQAYQGIRQMFVRGEFQPGQRVSQSKLARQLGCSTVPVVEAMRRCDLVHLATHGTSDGLYFAGTSEADAKLSMAEVQALSLPRTRLVVLSACDTFSPSAR